MVQFCHVTTSHRRGHQPGRCIRSAADGDAVVPAHINSGIMTDDNEGVTVPFWWEISSIGPALAVIEVKRRCPR